MDEDWILTCNLENLKEELLQVGLKSLQVFSLRNKDKTIETTLEANVDLKSVMSQYL
jgi:hypothetical protein